MGKLKKTTPPPRLEKPSQKSYAVKRAVRGSRERELFERMVKAQERIAAAIEKQKPGRGEKILATGAALASSMGLVSIAKTIITWFGG